MKKAVFALIIMILLAIPVFAAEQDIKISEDVNDYYPTDRTFYLPSNIDETKVKMYFTSGTMIIQENAENSISVNSGDLVDFTIFTKNEKGYYSVYIKENESTLGNKYRFYFASSLPTVYIKSSIGKSSLMSDVVDENAKVTIFDKDSNILYKDTNMTKSEFKTRGNATNSYMKKPFQLKLNDKTDLFDMGKAKTWILLANYIDQSTIRNTVCFEIGKALGMDTSSYQFVDVFIDGEYNGIYLLCEKVQIGKNRVNIFDLEKENDALNSAYSSNIVTVNSGELINSCSLLTEYRYVEGVVNPADITGGYLIELDNNYYRDEKCYFTTVNTYISNGEEKTDTHHYVIKSPENASKEQVEYIAKLFADMEEAIYSPNGINKYGKHYSEYIDINSLVYAYIVAEYTRNYDAGSSSMYFYKDRDINDQVSKIYKGPLWDCDNTLGNISRYGSEKQNTYWAKGRSIWRGLTQHQEFNDLVTQSFERIYPKIYEMVSTGGFIEKEVESIGTSIYMEQKKWNSDDKSKWPLYIWGAHMDTWQKDVFKFVDTYSDGINEGNDTTIGFLCNIMVERAEWLKTEWNCNVEQGTRLLRTNEPPDETYITNTAGSDSEVLNTDTADTGTQTDTDTQNTQSETDSGVQISDIDTQSETNSDVQISDIDTQSGTNSDVQISDIDTQSGVNSGAQSGNSETDSQFQNDDKENDNKDNGMDLNKILIISGVFVVLLVGGLLITFKKK